MKPKTNANMSRREELERQLEIAQHRVDTLPEGVPEEVISDWHKELDSISFELNNLYDDYEMGNE